MPESVPFFVFWHPVSERGRRYEMGEGEAGQLLSGMEFLEGGGKMIPSGNGLLCICGCNSGGFGLFLLYLLVRKIAEYLGSLTFDGDEKVFLKPEEIVKKESRSRRRNPFFSRFPFLSGSHSERVRRLYQKSVRKRLGQNGVRRRGNLPV